MSEAITFMDLRFYHTSLSFLLSDWTAQTRPLNISSYLISSLELSSQQRLYLTLHVNKEGRWREPWLNHVSQAPETYFSFLSWPLSWRTGIFSLGSSGKCNSWWRTNVMSKTMTESTRGLIGTGACQGLAPGLALNSDAQRLGPWPETHFQKGHRPVWVVFLKIMGLCMILNCVGRFHQCRRITPTPHHFTHKASGLLCPPAFKTAPEFTCEAEATEMRT